MNTSSRISGTYVYCKENEAGNREQIGLKNAVTHVSQDQGQVVRCRLERNPSEDANLKYESVLPNTTWTVE